MIKATIQNSPYCTEIRFPCSETELSKKLGEIKMNPENLAPVATVIEIEPAELSILEDCDVSLDALNFLGKRMDGMCESELRQGSRVYLTSGDAVTQCSGSGGGGGKTGLYLIDQNPNPQITDNARCITARQDSGVSNHRGEHSAVLVEEPQPIINPFKEHTRQNGRRVKNPGEPMFTITVTDRHGIVHCGRIRRLMPIECWALQGFSRKQFNKVAALGMSDAQLYKQAGNAVTTKVIEAIGRRLKEFDEKYSHEIETVAWEKENG